jgi:hypothetical protein
MAQATIQFADIVEYTPLAQVGIAERTGGRMLQHSIRSHDDERIPWHSRQHIGEPRHERIRHDISDRKHVSTGQWQ